MPDDSDKPRYSIVVPVYESSTSVVELVSRVVLVFEERVKASFEIILVDDGSRSRDTRSALKNVRDMCKHVRVFRLMRNYGKAGAVLCGMSHARGQWVITIDDDLQQNPEDIPALIEFEKHDVVVGVFKARQDSVGSRLTSWIKGNFDQVILGVPFKMAPLKLIRREVIEGMLRVKTNRPFIPALLAYATNDFVSVVVPHSRSKHSESRFGTLRRIRQFSNLVIGNSTILLRVIGAFGASLAFGGFCFAVYVFARKLLGSSIAPGWASLIVINLAFGGLILLTLGMIGEYLLRILEGTHHRPAYIIREEIGRQENQCDDNSIR